MNNAKHSPTSRRKAGACPVHSQAAALCYRIHQNRPEILLITTRRSGRWIIPRGWPILGLSPSETAEREAWEEAGAVGRCDKKAMGRYTYIKHRSKKRTLLCEVDVFAMLVSSLASDFPESDERKREWCVPEKAALRVNSLELSVLLRDFGQYPCQLLAGRA